MDDNKLKNKNVETYTADMVKAIESDKGGLIKKIIHEEEEHEAEKINLSPKSKKNRLFMLISITLVIFSVAILISLAFFNKSTNTISVAPQFAPIIFTDQTDFTPIDGLTKGQIMETISNQIDNAKVKIGGIESVYLMENKEVVGFRRFISLMNGNLASDQISPVSDNFLLGRLNDKTENFFMLLKVDSFADIFPVMRGWENKMLYDLHGFFGVDINPETNYLFTKDWQDGIVANKNARILRNNDRKIILMYVFVNDASVIITNSEAVTQEVISRLTSSQIKK